MLDEVARHNDPLDMSAKLLTYQSIYVPSFGLMRLTLQRSQPLRR